MPSGEVRIDPIRVQMAAALDETGVSARELGRRFFPDEPRRAESKRRWVQKLLAGKPERPWKSSLRELEEKLGLQPGYFKLPPVRREPDQEWQDRLAALENEAVRSPDLDRFLHSTVKLTSATRHLVAGVQALEAGDSQEARREIDMAADSLLDLPDAGSG